MPEGNPSDGGGVPFPKATRPLTLDKWGQTKDEASGRLDAASGKMTWLNGKSIIISGNNFIFYREALRCAAGPGVRDRFAASRTRTSGRIFLFLQTPLVKRVSYGHAGVVVVTVGG